MPSNRLQPKRTGTHSTAATSDTQVAVRETAAAPVAAACAATVKKVQVDRARIGAERKSALGILPNGATTVSADERKAMVEQAAYFRAQRRGFAFGHELEDWVAAEQEVDQFLTACAPSSAGSSYDELSS